MNRYQMLGQLGDGSFGVVSKAQLSGTDEIVAVKKMKQKFTTWEECLQLREVQSLRKIQHPNIIKLREAVRENNELFLIFEYMEQNVFQIQRQRAEKMGNTASMFSDREIRSIMCQTLLGLAVVHKGGFMHRDLKPENLLTKGDLVKIADFGLAKEIRSRPPFTEYVSTRWYRAPEIILHSTHYNSPIDIWACGVILVELFLNRPLFPGSSDADQLFRICSVLGTPSPTEWEEGHALARRMNIRFPSVAVTPLRQLLPHASPAAIDLMEQMLKFNPSDRPTSSQCLQHAFFTNDPSDPEYNGQTSSLYAGIATGEQHNPFFTASTLLSQNTPLASGSSGNGTSSKSVRKPSGSASLARGIAGISTDNSKGAGNGKQSAARTQEGNPTPSNYNSNPNVVRSVAAATNGGSTNRVTSSSSNVSKAESDEFNF